MAGSKIVDEAEVLHWFEEGRTYSWMQEEYERKYNITTSANMWAAFRRRRGLERRQVRDDNLIPWFVKAEHRHQYAVAMLRLEARVRQDQPISSLNTVRLAAWKANLAEGDLVVHYDPDTDQGFYFVPRRPNIDKDLIREPEKKTTAWVERQDDRDESKQK